MIPDHEIFGTGQTDIIDVLGLGIDQEIHYETMTTA
jgi:hypothetical protein